MFDIQTFTPDSRWLVSASTDCTVRTWDLPSGNCVDVFRTESVATSVSFSPTGDFLASVHVGHVGIFLWSNRSQYESFGLRSVGEDEILEIGLPLSVSVDVEVEDVESSIDIAAGEAAAYKMNVSSDLQLRDEHIYDRGELDDEMIKLSAMPKSKWQTLLHLDAIKLRNKPVAPQKASEPAPFFLPVLAGAVPKFDLEKRPVDESSKILKMDTMDIDSEFTRLLIHASDSNTHEQFFEYLLTLNASSLDFFIRSLSPYNDMREIKAFIQVSQSRLLSRMDFELVNVLLSVMFRIHGDIIMGDEGLIEAVTDIKEALKNSWASLKEKVNYSLCLLDFIRLSK